MSLDLCIQETVDYRAVVHEACATQRGAVRIRDIASCSHTENLKLAGQRSADSILNKVVGPGPQVKILQRRIIVYHYQNGAQGIKGIILSQNR
jgi:hypothetical protein